MHHSSNNEIIYCDLPQGANRINDKKFPQKVFIATCHIEKLKTPYLSPHPHAYNAKTQLYSVVFTFQRSTPSAPKYRPQFVKM